MKPYFERNGITIYNADCREILPELQPVDHVITDPPYARDIYVRLGMPNTKKGSGSPARLLGESFELNNGARMSQLAAGAIGHIDEMLEGVAAEISRLTRRWALLWCDIEEGFPGWRQQVQAHGMRYVRAGIWCKTDPSPQFTGDRPAQGFETCAIAHADKAMRWNGGGHAAVWHGPIAKGNDRPDHPCPKPLWLMRAQVEQFTDPGETILDPFAGSGTTGLAAYLLGRKAILIELEEKWAQGAAERIEALDLPMFPELPPTPQQELAL